MMSREVYPPALSKTAKYKKITKPLLERKRRARINRCLDELKDLMVGALEIDDDNISKLEKADILELTVNHLTKLHSPRDAVSEANRFQAGFNGCAAEACRYILTLPDLDANVSQSLVHHLTRLTSTQPLSVQTFSPPTSPINSANYNSDQYSPEVEDDLSPEIADQYRSRESLSYEHERPNYAEMSTYVNSSIQFQDVSAPMTGLLTTVDRIRKQPLPTQSYKIRPQKDDFQSEPIINESKEEILQKIRQHIMERRNNDVRNSPEKHSPEKHLYNIGYKSVPTITSTRNSEPELVPEEIYKYQNDYEERVETLDLTKKTRKLSPEVVVQSSNDPNVSLVNTSFNPVHKRPLTNDANDMKTEKQPEIAKIKIIDQNNELPMDYHNLPPKKKRKHLEFQMEMMRRQAQEKAALQEIASAAENSRHVAAPGQQIQQHEGDYQPSSWRPW